MQALVTPIKRGKAQGTNGSDGTPGSKGSDNSARRRNREQRSRKFKTPAEEPVVIEEVKEEPIVSSPPEVRTPPFAESFSKVVFKIYYKTIPKQDLFMIGDHDLFANWEDSKLGFPMKWTSGHIWVAEISEDALPNDFEFKFIVKERDGSLTWEKRENRKFLKTKIIDTLKNNHKYRSYGKTTIYGGEVEFEHDQESGVTTLSFTWPN